MDWIDTDASGHYHHSAVIRWVEAAEVALHSALGLEELFGVVPRVRYEVDYLDRLWFRDAVTITLTVGSVGRSSVRYDFEVRRGNVPAARGLLTAVHADPHGSGATPWPDSVRARLTGDEGLGVP